MDEVAVLTQRLQRRTFLYGKLAGYEITSSVDEGSDIQEFAYWLLYRCPVTFRHEIGARTYFDKHVFVRFPAGAHHEYAYDAYTIGPGNYAGTLIITEKFRDE